MAPNAFLVLMGRRLKPWCSWQHRERDAYQVRETLNSGHTGSLPVATSALWSKLSYKGRPWGLTFLLCLHVSNLPWSMPLLPGLGVFCLCTFRGYLWTSLIMAHHNPVTQVRKYEVTLAFSLFLTAYISLMSKSSHFTHKCLLSVQSSIFLLLLTPSSLRWDTAESPTGLYPQSLPSLLPYSILWSTLASCTMNITLPYSSSKFLQRFLYTFRINSNLHNAATDPTEAGSPWALKSPLSFAFLLLFLQWISNSLSTYSFFKPSCLLICPFHSHLHHSPPHLDVYLSDNSFQVCLHIPLQTLDPIFRIQPDSNWFLF